VASRKSSPNKSKKRRKAKRWATTRRFVFSLRGVRCRFDRLDDWSVVVLGLVDS
jgi:hypothetical protein